MSGFDPEIARELAKRDRFRLARWRTLSLEQRVAEMMSLQQYSWDLLRASPAGYAHWLRRNFAKRAVVASPEGADRVA